MTARTALSRNKSGCSFFVALPFGDDGVFFAFNDFALFGVDGIDVPGANLDSETFDLFKLGLDPRHGPATIAVNDRNVYSLLRELLSSREAETT